MLLKIRSAQWRKGLANASMNLNSCVKWPRQTASGGRKNCGWPISDCGLMSVLPQISIFLSSQIQAEIRKLR